MKALSGPPGGAESGHATIPGKRVSRNCRALPGSERASAARRFGEGVKDGGAGEKRRGAERRRGRPPESPNRRGFSAESPRQPGRTSRRAQATRGRGARAAAVTSRPLKSSQNRLLGNGAF